MEELEAGIYAELRRLAAAKLRRERHGHTLSPTALVHEAYLRMAGQLPTDGRTHFIALSALMMRRILVTHARARGVAKRGGGERPVTLDEALVGAELPLERIVALDDMLTKLEAINERHARVVSYRVFGGLSDIEIAEELGVSAPTVRRDWRVARAWIIRELGEGL